MTIAAQRLREDDVGIGDVAQAVGYANPVAFSKAFARLCTEQGIDSRYRKVAYPG